MFVNEYKINTLITNLRLKKCRIKIFEMLIAKMNYLKRRTKEDANAKSSQITKILNVHYVKCKFGVVEIHTSKSFIEIIFILNER